MFDNSRIDPEQKQIDYKAMYEQLLAENNKHQELKNRKDAYIRLLRECNVKHYQRVADAEEQYLLSLEYKDGRFRDDMSIIEHIKNEWSDFIYP